MLPMAAIRCAHLDTLQNSSNISRRDKWLPLSHARALLPRWGKSLDLLSWLLL